MKTPKTKEEAISIAEEYIKLLDEETDDSDNKVKVPSWLKIDKKLQYYFMWKTTHWENPVGWYHREERVNVGEAAL